MSYKEDALDLPVRPLLEAHARDVLLEDGHSDFTAKGYKLDLEQLCRDLEAEHGREPVLADFTEPVLQAWLTGRAGKGQKAATVARKRCSVRSFLKFVARHPELPGPGHVGALLRVAKRQRPDPKFLSKPEMVDLCAAPEGFLTMAGVGPDPPARLSRRGQAICIRDAAMLSFLYETGLRASETSSIDLEDLKRDCPKQGDLLMQVRRGKGRKSRRLVIKKKTQALLDAYLALRPLLAEKGRAGRALFVGCKGERLTRHGVLKAVGRWGKEAQLHAYPHLLRHSCATHLRHNKVPLEYISKHLGHASLSTTEMYAHAAPDEMELLAARHPLNCPDSEVRTTDELLAEVARGQRDLARGQEELGRRMAALEARERAAASRSARAVPAGRHLPRARRAARR